MSRKTHKTRTFHGDPRDNRESEHVSFIACVVEERTWDLSEYLRYLAAIAPKPILT